MNDIQERLVFLSLQGWVPLIGRAGICFRKYGDPQEIIYPPHIKMDGAIVADVWVRKDLIENFHLLNERYKQTQWKNVNICIQEFLRLAEHDSHSTLE